MCALQVRYVKGIDLSPAEIKEAERRYEELKQRDRGEWREGAGGSGLEEESARESRASGEGARGGKG